MNKTITRRTHPTQSNLLDSHPLLNQIYQTRGITDKKQLDRTLASLHAHTQFRGMEEAVKLLGSAIAEEQRILIVGDFDADGATSTALAVTALRQMGARHVAYLVPNRFEFGYGLTPEIVELATAQQPQIIITVDNGISSHAGIDAANQRGMKVLVTDHHLPGETLPNAAAIVNPNQPGCDFPSKHIAGVGVIFYVMSALRTYLRETGWFSDRHIREPNMAQYLDLVALGTVADVVMLDHTNRILVYQGLLRIRAGKTRPGIQALLHVAKREASRITAADLGFALGPRLNAAGRLDDMSIGINCLLSENLQQARGYAETLDELNRERRVIEQDMQQQAWTALEKISLNTEQLPHALSLYDETWHQGVIGILASRVKDRYYRPVIAFAEGNEHELKGSARSIPGLHIRDVLANMAAIEPTLISKFGGHAMAAGLTIAKKEYPRFSKLFNQVVQQSLSQELLLQRVESDGSLSPDIFNLDTADLLQAAGPWGQGFPEPLFDDIFEICDQQIVGGKHLKLRLRLPGVKFEVSAIAFNVDLKSWPNHHCRQIHAAYRLDVNEFNELRQLQLVIEEFKSL